MNSRSPARALVSVTDKRGLVPLCEGLRRLGVELVSTGGTARHLREAGIEVLGVSELTGFPELLGGRVKTLHPCVHAGILARRDVPADMAALATHGIGPIDLVVVNLYAFRETVARPDVERAEALESIDIGGPALLRAAAKNHAHVSVVVDPADYSAVLAELSQGGTQETTRARLAKKAFEHTAGYDIAIATWFAETERGPEPTPERIFLDLGATHPLRYGENPHQRAALYGEAGHGRAWEVLQGKALSYNNLLDADAAWSMVCDLGPDPASVYVKHLNPCGAATHPVDHVAAAVRARACDPVSAFGAVVAVNKEVDLALARVLAETFLEVVVAPRFAADALDVLREKKNLRLVCIRDGVPAGTRRILRATVFGVLVQEPDAGALDLTLATCPTRRQPAETERRAMAFAWRVSKHVKSNAIVIADEQATVGIGAGQMSRVDAARLAIGKATLPLAGTSAASDGFFPFPDGIEVLAAGGVTAIVQPGGSVRDAEVVAAADALGLAMWMTGARHFRH